MIAQLFYMYLRKQTIVLLSTMHSDKIIDKVTKKPDIIPFYYSSKAGIVQLPDEDEGGQWHYFIFF